MTITSPDLTCKEFVELVTDYLEGALPAHERQRFEAHLATCPGSSNYLDHIRNTINLTGCFAQEQLDPAARDALLQAFRKWKWGARK